MGFIHDNYATDFHFVVLTGKDKVAGNEYGISKVQFSKISGIESKMEYEEIMEGGKNDGPHILTVPHKIHQPLIFEHGIASAGSWFEKLRPGMRLNTWLIIVVMGKKREITPTQFGINDGIVTRIETGGLDAMGSSILVEKLEIMHDGIYRQKIV